MALDYYKLLGIPPDAELQHIKAVYRRMAKRFHPDTNQGSEAAAELFRQVNQAYRVLSDSKTREKYDRELNLKRKEDKSLKAATASKTADSQEKFNRFVNSLLDAMFGPIAEPKSAPVPKAKTQTLPPRKSGKPAFNFYYHLALERDSNPYVCGEDGIFRKKPPQPRAKNNRAPSTFGV